MTRRLYCAIFGHTWYFVNIVGEFGMCIDALKCRRCGYMPGGPQDEWIELCKPEGAS